MRRHREPTRALLIAGRAIQTSKVTVGALRALREVAAAYPDVEVTVASDEHYDGAPSKPSEPLLVRIVVGVVAASVSADDDPRPVALADLERALAQVRRVDPALWAQLAALIGPEAPPFLPAQIRGAFDHPHVSPKVARGYEAVALDGPDLLVTEDRVHLVPNGPLSHAALARGVLGELPRDEDGYLPEDLEGWVHGQCSDQEPPKRGVQGECLGVADMLGLGTLALDLATLASGDLYLIARYD